MKHVSVSSKEDIELALKEFLEGWVGPCRNCKWYDDMGWCTYWQREKNLTGGCPVRSIAFNRVDKSKEIQFWM